MLRTIGVLPIQAVEDYYDHYNHKKTWKLVHTGRYKVKEQKGEEPVEMDIDIYKNVYGDTYISDGICVMRHVIVDSRGWIIEWLDEDPYAVVIVPHWIELTDFYRRFHTGHTIVTTHKYLEERIQSEVEMRSKHK